MMLQKFVGKHCFRCFRRLEVIEKYLRGQDIQATMRKKFSFLNYLSGAKFKVGGQSTETELHNKNCFVFLKAIVTDTKSIKKLRNLDYFVFIDELKKVASKFTKQSSFCRTAFFSPLKTNLEKKSLS